MKRQVMKLYMYRTVENLDRDLDIYSKNYFWASSKEDLNDENEFTYNSGPFFEELKVYKKLEKTLFGKNSSVSRVIESAKDLFNHAQNSGVFSLSTDPKDSGMWSLYASKGKGYCLVFDSDTLMKIVDDPISEQRFLLPVDYIDDSSKGLMIAIDNYQDLSEKLKSIINGDINIKDPKTVPIIWQKEIKKIIL